MNDIPARGGATPKSREQANDLADRIAQAIQAYSNEQDAAGTPMLMNDMLSALAHVTGSMIGSVPLPDLRTKLYSEIGRMISLSVKWALAHGGGVDVEIFSSAPGKTN